MRIIFLEIKELDEDEFAKSFSNHLINDLLGKGPYKGLKKITAKVILNSLKTTDELIELVYGSLNELDEIEGDK